MDSSGSAADGPTPIDSTLPDTSCTGRCEQLPPGWSLVGLDLTKSGICPNDYLSSNVIAYPQIDATLCTDGCTPGAAVCTGGTIAYQSRQASCAYSGSSPLSEVAGCQSTYLAGTGVGAGIQFTPSSTSAAGCNITGAVKIAPNARLCSDPGPTICNGSTCHPGLVSPFQAVSSHRIPPRQAALRASQLPSTPPGPRFAARRRVRSPQAAGAWWSSTRPLICSGSATSIPADGMCSPYSDAIQSFEYMPIVSGAACRLGTPPPPTVTTPNLVCCP